MSERWANVHLAVGGRVRRYVAAAVFGLGAFAFAYKHAELGVVREVLGSRDESTFAARAFMASRNARPGIRITRGLNINDRLGRFYQAALGADSLEGRIRAGEPLISWTVMGDWTELDSWLIYATYGPRIGRWTHFVPGSVQRADAGADSARMLAEAELGRLGFDPASLLFSATTENRTANRTERTFRWEIPARRAVLDGDTARSNLVVAVAGDEVRSATLSITTPRDPVRIPAQTRGVLLTIVIVALVSLVVGALVVTVRQASRDTLQWAPALRLAAVGPIALLAGYTIPRVARGMAADPQFQRALSSVTGEFMGDLSLCGTLWLVAALIYAMSESLANDKRPDVFFGLNEWSRGRFAAPETVSAALSGYASALLALAVGYGALALARNVFGAPFEVRPFHSFVFTTPAPWLAIPFATSVVVTASVGAAASMAFASHRGWPLLPVAATFAILAGAGWYGETVYDALRVTVEALFGFGLVYLVRERGALAAMVAVYVFIGAPIAADLIWAGGPYAMAGTVSVGFLTLPAIAAVVAYQRRPWAVHGKSPTPARA